jgi:hypothetical protein
LTFEAQQELSPEGGNEIFGVRATAPRTDSRTQDLQEFYDKFRNSSIAQFFTSIEGPLVLRGGLDRPMARGAIVLTTKPNFRARTLLFGTSWEYTAGGPAADFNGPVESGFKLLPKEGSPAIAGSTTGLVQVLNVGVFNINQATPDDGTLFLSYTLDGTVFSEAILPNPAPPSAVNYAIAFSALMDAIDADPRFEVVNRLEDISSTSFAAQIVAVTPNSPFEHFADVGKGLRIEFRDLSP